MTDKKRLESTAEIIPAQSIISPRTALAGVVVGLVLLLFAVAVYSRLGERPFTGNTWTAILGDFGIVASVFVLVGIGGYLVHVWMDAHQARRIEADLRKAMASQIANAAPGTYSAADDKAEFVTAFNSGPAELLSFYQAEVAHRRRIELDREKQTGKLLYSQAQHFARLMNTATPLLEAEAKEDAPPPLLPVLLKSQRTIINAPPDAGKSTLGKHIIAGRADHRQVIIDPHAPSKLLGIDVIGAGRDFDGAYRALESLVELMSDRYADVEAGRADYFSHAPVNLVMDELTALLEARPETAELIKTLFIESRKVNFRMTLLAHSATVESLGIDSHIRRAAMIVELSYDPTTETRRAFVLPSNTKGPDGKRPKPMEYTPPGPFNAYPQVNPSQVVLELPGAKLIRTMDMARRGESKTACAKFYYDTPHPNGRQMAELTSLLKAAFLATTQARQTHDTGTTLD